MSTFLDEVRTEQQSRKSSTCQMGKYLAGLTEERRGQVEAALADPELQGSVIADVLSREPGLTIAGSSVNRHRSQRCACC